MAGDPLVAVSYPVDGEFSKINSEVLDGLAETVFLHGIQPEQQRQELARADAIIGWNPPAELGTALAGAGRLRFVQLLSAGADGVDFAAFSDDVVIASNVGAYAKPIAEHVMAMTLALARRLPQRHAGLAAGDFNQRDPLLTLDGAVCAILGFGGIGVATAALMRAFGARIYAVNSTGRTSEPADFAGTLADLDHVLASADVLVIALPLTKATRGLLGERELALMKPTAILVNVSRAAIIDEAALYQYLRTYPQSGAGIDTWWHEPTGGSGFRTDYPFFDLPNLIGSPHNSGIVPGTLAHAARAAAQNVARFLRGEPVRGLVHREDYP